MTSSAGRARRSATTRREVLAEQFGGGQSAVDVGHQPDELDRPALELRKVLLGEPQQARDHPYGELEGELADQVGPAVGHEAVDQLVDDRADELGLPPRQGLLTEALATRLRWLRCSGSSMPRIMWPITMPMVTS